MRTAIYAGFSTDLQQARSIDDQVALCRTHAGKAGLTVVSVYSDSARSGASMFGRDGLMRMMDAALDKAFDVILVEARGRLAAFIGHDVFPSKRIGGIDGSGGGTRENLFSLVLRAT